MALPGFKRHSHVLVLALFDELRRHFILESEHQPAPHRPNDVRSPPFLPLLDHVHVPVVGLGDERHSASPRDCRRFIVQHSAGMHQLSLAHQHSRRLRAADELVRRQENSVHVRGRGSGSGGEGSRGGGGGGGGGGRGVHVDGNVRACGGEVEERKGVVLVQDGGNGGSGAQDACDVGPSGERPNFEFAIRIVFQDFFQVRKIYSPGVAVFPALYNLGATLSPREDVGVVFVRADDNQGFHSIPQVLLPCFATTQLVEHFHDGSSRATAAEENHVLLLVRVDRRRDHVSSVLAKL
mmetsp:Transcript_23023/g.46536  ORF Transcript_23023/g.46536 Transcript_23023/m.46536 type:complete len:295 (-) Transcript_23023:598-1482(-)